jgi:pimeloyl-ACP methyl ester carboxylesterase
VQAISTSLDIYNEFTGGILLPLVKSGRAVLYPVYKGTFERGGGEPLPNSNTYQYTEYFIKVVKDFRRCIDYLQKRSDIDSQRLVYFGSSWGGRFGAIIPAVEDRLAASILAVGGLSRVGRPEVNAINYVGRVKVPTLMLNGRYDLVFPYESSVKPMFDLLGRDCGLKEDDTKKIMLYDTDHGIPRQEVLKETQAWLDRFLGPVK